MNSEPRRTVTNLAGRDARVSPSEKQTAVITKDGKPDPLQRTAHELRNFGFGAGMPMEVLRGYLDIMKEKVA